MENFNELLHNLYYDIHNSSVAYTSKKNLYAKAKLLNKNITKKLVDIWWRSQKNTTLFKPIRKHYKRSKIYVKAPSEQMQIDLIDFSKLKKSNNNVSYILVGIDCFSKKIWAFPAKTKTAKEISPILEKIIKESKVKRIQSDNGGEFVNSTMNLLFSKYNIAFYTTLNADVKCSMIERAIRTLKTRIFKYFSQKNTSQWIDILSHVVNGYNSTIHRSTGFAPNKVNTSVQNTKIRRKLYGKKMVAKSYKYDLGDNVRISRLHSVFYKGYLQQWSDEIFKIVGRKRLSDVNLYSLSDLLGEKLKGYFYEPELQQVAQPEFFSLEKILKEKKIAGKKRYFVKWLNWPEKFNSWVSEDQLIKE